MRQVVVVICTMLAAAVGAAASPASEAGRKSAWTESKAERLVQRGATVALPADDRAALEEELRRAVALYLALGAEAWVSGDAGAGDEGALNGSSLYYELAYRYAQALKKVRAGLAVDAIDCRGSGQGVAGRFSGFRCSVSSAPLEIPSVELAEDGRVPVEGSPRSVGPIEAELDVRVTGPSSFAYRKL